MSASRPADASRRAGVPVTIGIIGLTLVTGYIHSTLGGLLFTLNAIGYAGLATLLVVASIAPIEIARRLAWLPRVLLLGYALATIGGYLVIGPYFVLGWITKAVEVALVSLLVIDLRRSHRSVGGLIRDARAAVSWLIAMSRRPAAAEWRDAAASSPPEA